MGKPFVPGIGQMALSIAAGGIFDGRGIAAALMLGAAGVNLGTRFITSIEAIEKRQEEN